MTAYELRISDWSSDVCSSDLFLAGQQDGDMAVVGRQPHPRDPHVPVLDQFGPRADDGAKVDFADDPRRDRGGSAIAERLAAVEINDHQAEIGRASCREIECQYV